MTPASNKDLPFGVQMDEAFYDSPDANDHQLQVEDHSAIAYDEAGNKYVKIRADLLILQTYNQEDFPQFDINELNQRGNEIYKSKANEYENVEMIEQQANQLLEKLREEAFEQAFNELEGETLQRDSIQREQQRQSIALSSIPMMTPMGQMNASPDFSMSMQPMMQQDANMAMQTDHQNDMQNLKQQLSQMMDARERDKMEMERLKNLEQQRLQKGLQLIDSYKKSQEEVKQEKSRTIESIYLESSGQRGFRQGSVDDHVPNVIRNIEDMSEDELTLLMPSRSGSRTKEGIGRQRRGSMNDIQIGGKRQQKHSVLREHDPQVTLRQIQDRRDLMTGNSFQRPAATLDTAPASKQKFIVREDKRGGEEVNSDDGVDEMTEQEIFNLELEQLRRAAKESGARSTQELMGEMREVKKIHTRDMSRLFKSKQSIYDILVVEGQYYLPPIEECTIDYLRDLFSGRKKYLLNTQVKMIHVPKMPELTAQSLIKNVARDQKLRLYFPDLVDSEGKYRTISRQFLFNIINTLKPNFFPDNITALMKQRKEHEAEKKQSFIEVKSHIYNLIVNSNLVSRSSRGKAVHLLSAAMTTKKRSRPEGMKRAERVVFDLAVGLDGSSNSISSISKTNKRSDLDQRFSSFKVPITVGGGQVNETQSTIGHKDSTMNMN